MTDSTNAELLDQLLKPEPSHSTKLWRFTTIPSYGRSRAFILAMALKNLGALKTFEFEYSKEPSIFVTGHTSPLSFESSDHLWDSLINLYELFTMGSKVLEIKTELFYYEMVSTGFKLNELRRNDRDYRVGDYVIMGEMDNLGGYTGRAIGARINWLLAGEEAERWMLPGYCNFGLSEIIVMVLENQSP